jgi:hypothetical protein
MRVAGRVRLRVRRRDHEQPVRAQNAPQLVERCRLALDVLDRLEADTGLEARVAERQRFEVARLERQARARERARAGDRVPVQVDADHLGRAAPGEDLGSVAGAAARVEHAPALDEPRRPQVAGGVLRGDQAPRLKIAVEPLGCARGKAAQFHRPPPGDEL